MRAAEEIIAAYVDAQRAIDEADRAYIEKSRLMRAACKRSTELALKAAGQTLSRGDRLELVSNFYWLDTDAAPMPVLEGLKFHAPTGFPREGIPLLLTGEACGKCGEETVKQSRQGLPHCPRCWMGVQERDVREYMQSRGAVRITEDQKLEWI